METKYFKPKSLTWWSGFGISFGTIVIAFVSLLGENVGIPYNIVTIARLVIDESSAQEIIMSILVGTGFIGIRGAMDK